MSKYTPEQGWMIGYCVVTESDLPMDAFGNKPSGANPIVHESVIYEYESKAIERAENLKRYGRVYVCEMRFHCEVM